MFDAILKFIASPSPAAKPRRDRYPNFDILRLLLAVEVAFAHGWYTIDPTFGWSGFVMAVPAFLAISGFLVLQSYSESGSWVVFIRKRVLRVVPALAVSLVLCLLLFGWHGLYNSFLNWVTGGLYTENGFANGPLWSLAWEELAYALLALLWLLGAYKRPACIWGLLLASILIVWACKGLDPHVTMIFFLGPAFFIGNLMFIYRDSLLGVSGWIPWLFFYVMLRWPHVPESNAFNGAALLVFQAFAVVWVGMAGLKVVPFRFPDISYGVYVYHYPILMFLFAVVGVTAPMSLAIWLGVCVVVFSLVSWYLVEKPALRYKLSKISTSAPTSSILISDDAQP